MKKMEMNEKNPVLLFISGGPGVPEVWLNEAYADVYPNKLADYFTVCYWDYYGEGLSYDSDLPAKIPVAFLSGYYDYTTPITLSKELYEKLEAPEKSFYTFYKSAHSPLWEENELTIEAMLNHVR